MKLYISSKFIIDSQQLIKQSFNIIYMHTLALRAFHQSAESVSLAYMILFFVVSYVVLLLSAYFFYQGFLYTSRKSDIYP